MKPTVTALDPRSLARALLLFGAAIWITALGSHIAMAQGTGGQSAKPEAPAAEVSYATRLDKTAVWVGDQFHYQIIVDHTPQIQFVLENLNKDNIIMEPLRVMDAATSSYTLKNGNNRLFVDLTLANFSTDGRELQIPQLTLFFFRKEGGAASPQGEGAAAESLTINGPVIGLRSTLPSAAEDLRDAVTVSGWPRNRWIVTGVGWLALFILGAGLVWEGAQMILYRKGRKGPDPRKAMAKIRERWSRSVPTDFSDVTAVMEFYGRSYQDVKEYLGYALETHTEGLTAEDMREEIARRTTNPELTERTAKVLATCEIARYGRNGNEISSDAARAVQHDVQRIFEAASKL